SFNKSETRERVRALMSQGDYKRNIPLAFIQSSDAHGKRGRIGQPRTDISVPNGRPTFSNIRDSLRHAGRVKCSVDFVEEEYSRVTRGETVFRYKAIDSLTFSPKDHEQIAIQIAGILNSRSGAIELEGILSSEDTKVQEKLEEHLREIASIRLASVPFFVLSREFRFSSSRIKIIFKPIALRRLATINGTVYVVDATAVRPATATEVETIVAQNIEFRFGNRFTDALEDISSRSILLSRMPAAIPLLLRCREKFEYLDEDDIKSVRLEPSPSRKLETLEFSDL